MKCVHCGRGKPVHPWGLCLKCANHPAWVMIYRPRPYHTLEFLARLAQYRERACKRLPLFEGEKHGD